MPDKTKGLMQKYRVERVDGKPVGWAFVLQDTDPFAVPALRAYAKAALNAGYVALADDLERQAQRMQDALAGRTTKEPTDV